MESDVRDGIWEMMEKIKSREGEPVDLEGFLMHSIGNVVFNLVFGKTWNENDETWRKLMSLQEEGTKLIGVAGPINFLPILRFLPKFKKIIRYIETGIVYSHDIYQKILEDFKRDLPPGGGFDDNTTGETHFLGAFHRKMVEMKNERSFYTLEQFNYLMADLWGAGVDTTMTTLRWFFLYVAHYQNVQLKIQKEMDDVLNDKNLRLEDVPSLPYLQACISEAQRLRSVTPLGIPHGTLQDTVLDGYHIPKGTMIVPLQWAIHMSPTYHKNPGTYDPSRFLDDEGKYSKPEAFIPFQTGKRICLGEDYAKTLLYLYGGTILQNFNLSLETDPDFTGEVGITLTPKPHRIIFSCRK
ncbi:hypothetical protein RUM43_005800 [Polyplax serrata]|uniref:Cytochrome P450 n=1 Tax=Polyplax serrata TaxID=468196 RepID=A0AAN8PA32_POLSC